MPEVPGITDLSIGGNLQTDPIDPDVPPSPDDGGPEGGVPFGGQISAPPGAGAGAIFAIGAAAAMGALVLRKGA